MARPTKMTPDVIKTAWQYIDNYAEYEHAFPSAIGLSDILNVRRSTLYEWGNKEDTEFPDILAKIQSRQELVLFQKSLSGEYNASIAKLALGKHGYHDRQVVESTNINVIKEIPGGLDDKSAADLYSEMIKQGQSVRISSDTIADE
jgi:hypothetical protein